MFFYTQTTGGEQTWKALPAESKDRHIAEVQPMFTSVLLVSKMLDSVEGDERYKLKYYGPMYFDWDGDLEETTAKCLQLLDRLASEFGLDLSMVQLYATGGRGYHAEIPLACFMPKVPKDGIQNLPTIFREMVSKWVVDTLDMRIYSEGRGRMWRTPNVQRPNGQYKVPITFAELREMTPELYSELTEKPRQAQPLTKAHMIDDLAIAFAAAAQVVGDKMKQRAKRKPDPAAKKKAKGTSVEMLMDGFGIREGIGFHQIAMQVAICATTAEMSEEEMLAACAGLIENHVSDGSRYNTPHRRAEELRRMHRYIGGNPIYDFSVGAIKAILVHPAADLDGMEATAKEIRETAEEAIKEEAEGSSYEAELDEYGDVAHSVTLMRTGIYVPTEDGNKRRICAVSFSEGRLLLSMETSQLIGYESQVLVNGKPTGRQTIELETFQSLQQFNKFCARLGHALQGQDHHVRGVMMRFVEQTKKSGEVRYVTKREGLDIVSIPNHDDLDLREPFMLWADNRGVILEPRVASKPDLKVQFTGYPDPRGLYKTDIGDAPALVEWLKGEGHKADLAKTLRNLMTCQRPDVMAKLLGWYTACHYRMIFHKVHGKFPLLHVNGSAGSGKTEMNTLLMRMFYLHQEPKILTPGSTVFSIEQHMASSASIPLMLDEYKPHEMNPETHTRLKLLFRSAYNCGSQSKGGGNRENDDYRALTNTQFAAPLVFVAEAVEEESAVSERVVLVTVVKPKSSVSLEWLDRFMVAKEHAEHLSILGHHLAAQAVVSTTAASLREEFDPMFRQARETYMLTSEDLKKGLSEEVFRAKQGAKERAVYNFTVAQYGLKKFRGLVEQIFGHEEFRAVFNELEGAVFERLSDLSQSTKAEWVKVMESLSLMSYHIEPDAPYNIQKSYAFVEFNGREAIEVEARGAYLDYRGWSRSTHSRPLFPNDSAFMHALKDSSATLNFGEGQVVRAPTVVTFDLAELSRLGVPIFKEKR